PETFLPRRKRCQQRHIFGRLVSMSESLPILDTCYRLYKQLYSINGTLPKAQYYRIGISTEETMLTLIEQLILAQNALKLQKRSHLSLANAQLELLRVKLRLYIELELANETRLFQSTAMTNDIGR